jgi:hypothetical protein
VSNVFGDGTCVREHSRGEEEDGNNQKDLLVFEDPRDFEIVRRFAGLNGGPVLV